MKICGISIFTLDQLPLMVCCTDSQGKGVYFNKEWLSFAEAELEQELSYGWVERVHPADVDRLMFKLSLAFKERAPFIMFTVCSIARVNIGLLRLLPHLFAPLTNFGIYWAEL